MLKIGSVWTHIGSTGGGGGGGLSLALTVSELRRILFCPYCKLYLYMSTYQKF